MSNPDREVVPPSAPVAEEGGNWRKKPIAVAAWQFDGFMAWELEDKPDWLVAALAMPVGPGCVARNLDALTIFTLEGSMQCLPSDWIVRGVKGELYPVRADIFAATYEPVGSGASPATGGSNETEQLRFERNFLQRLAAKRAYALDEIGEATVASEYLPDLVSKIGKILETASSISSAPPPDEGGSIRPSSSQTVVSEGLEEVNPQLLVIARHLVENPKRLESPTQVRQFMRALLSLSSRVTSLEEALGPLIEAWLEYEKISSSARNQGMPDAYYILAKNLRPKWETARVLLHPVEAGGDK